MGKRLIIPNADFSANAIDGIFTDITNIITAWTSGAYSANNGNTLSSSVFKRSSAKIDVSAYVGKEMRVTFCSYTTGSLAESLYGIAFYNSSSTFISGLKFPKNENVAGSAKTYYIVAKIPAGTKYMGVTYLNDAKVAEISGLPFQLTIGE